MITCTTFGFLEHGYLGVSLKGLRLPPVVADEYSFGFTLDKTESAGVSSYFENKRDKCVLRDESAGSGDGKHDLPSKSASSKENEQVALVVLRFELRNAMKSFEGSRIVLSTRGRSDLDELSFFALPELQYADWVSDDVTLRKTPPAFGIDDGAQRFKLYTTMWHRFFEQHFMALLETYTGIRRNGAATPRRVTAERTKHKQCKPLLVQRVVNASAASLGDALATLLSDAKRANGAPESYLPIVRKEGFRDGDASAKAQTGASDSAASRTDNLETFAEWFQTVINQLGGSMTYASAEARALTGGLPLTDKELAQLIACASYIINTADNSRTLRAFAEEKYRDAIFETFRVAANGGTLPLTYNAGTFNAQFIAAIERRNEEGLYTMYFHNCPPRENVVAPNDVAGASVTQQRAEHVDVRQVSFEMDIVEKNPNTFLSATECVLPSFNFAFAIVYAVLIIVWTVVLCRPTANASVFKIHYLMLLLLVLKTLAFLFSRRMLLYLLCMYHILIHKPCRIHESYRCIVAWRVGELLRHWPFGSDRKKHGPSCITSHILKGAVLFMTVALIGAGWAFVKHVLSERDKKILIIVIPLQVHIRTT